VLVAVTGATGFVGRHIVHQLERRGHRVKALTRRPSRAGFLAAHHTEIVPGDIADPAALAALVRSADAMIHLVGIIVESRGATFQAVHVDGTKGLLAAAATAGVRRFVHMSAVGARPDPDATQYHRTKWQAEELVRGWGMDAVIIQPSIINGPENAPIRTLARLHRWSPVVPVLGDGRSLTQPLWIEDAALAFVLAVERAQLRGTYQLGGADLLTFDEFVRAIGRASGHPRALLHVPLPLARVGARVCDPLGTAAPITSEQLQMLIEGSATPENAIESAFGIRPLGFEEGLRRFLSGVENQTRG
jgi:NADH dehydrogenase